MNALGWILACLPAGFILGVWASYRRIRQERKGDVRALLAAVTLSQDLRKILQNEESAARKIQSNIIGKRLFKILEEADVINITITEEGETEIHFDQEGLDEALGNTDDKTKH